MADLSMSSAASDDEYEMDKRSGTDFGAESKRGDSESAMSNSPRALFAEGDINPGGTFVAELGLLKSLKKPRTFGRVEQAGRQLNEISILKDENGNQVAPDALQQYRVDQDAELNRITQAELDEVKSLHHQGIKPGLSSTGLRKIRDLAENRKVRHDTAVDQYTEDRKSVYEEVERRVMAAGTTLKEALVDVDADIQVQFDELNNADILVTKDEQYVLNMWDAINATCERRSARITQFESELEAVERYRAETVGTRLKTLVRDLVAIAHELPPSIERLAESEAFKVNMVTIVNRRDYADVVARLRKADVVTYHAHHNRWELRRTAWRLLKHNRAVATYQSLLNSPRYTNPDERTELIHRLQASQQQRHESQRRVVIDSLAQLVPPNLTSAGVAGVQARLEDIDREEQADNRERFEQLRVQAEETVETSRRALEELRAELHSYGALSPEGDFGPIRAAMAPLLQGEDMEAFLIRSGGLKAELATILECLGLSTLIYESPLARLRDRADFVVSGLGLDGLLEEQGKADSRKALQDTLERMRVAKRTDMPNILPSLSKQVTAMAAVAGLNDRIRSELEGAAEALTEIVTEVRAVLGSTVGRTTVGTRTAGTRTARTGRGTSVSGRSVARSVARSTRSGKSGRTGRRGSQGSVLSGASGLGSLINMAEIRAIQRKVGSLVYACELPAELQQVLREVVAACQRQKLANEVVDDVVARDCAPLIEARANEYAGLVRRIGLALAKQATRLHRAGEKVCAFFLAAAKEAEAQDVLEDKTDETVQDDLDGALDDYEEADAKRESALQRALKRLRHAPDAAALERSLAAAMDRLADIEEGYRTYHKIATTVSDRHPVLVNNNLRNYRRGLCARFQLVFPKAEEVDGLSAEEIAARNAEAEGKAGGSAGPTGDGEGEGDGDGDASGEGDGDGKAQDGSDTAGDGGDGEAGGDGGAGDGDGAGGGEGKEDKVKAPAAPVAPVVDNWEELPVHATKGGTEYREILTPKDIAKRLLQSDSEDEDDEEDAVMLEAHIPADGDGADAGDADAKADAEVDAAAGDGSGDNASQAGGEGEGADGADGGASGAGTGEGKDGEGKDGSVAGEPAVPEFDERGVPLDPVGEPCVQFLEVRPSVLGKVIKALRNRLLNKFDKTASSRRAKMRVLRDDRVEALTEELEERLRRHWPRKGHAEVKVKQPREGELIAHKQRQERHARNILQRNAAHERAFEDVLKEAREDLAKFQARQAALAKALPSRTNLAALQGVLQKCKRFRADFKEACSDWHGRLQPFAHEEPQRLLQANVEFLGGCKLFSQGGEYAKEEVAISQKALSSVDDAVREHEAARKQRQAELQESQEAAMASFAEFQKEFDDCLQDLSMREGLGQKYGAPRRNCTARLRTEISWSNATEERIAADLKLLAELCDAEPGADAHNVDHGCLARHIFTVIDRIRTAQHRRARFLQAFKEGVREFDLTPLPLEDTPEEAAEAKAQRDAVVVEQTEEELAAEAKAAAHTFMAAVADMKRQCEDETRELYESEGKELPDGQMPASLQAYLDEQDEKARVQRDKSALAFREQVDEFQRLLLTAPVVVLRDVGARCTEECERYTGVEVKRFDKLIKAYEKVKKKHTKALKPQLSDPNELPALQALCEAEELRVAEVRSCIADARGKILERQLHGSEGFMSRLLFYTEKLMKMLDNTIIRTDLAPLPGDEDIVPERMSLKRLQKNLRKREAEAKADPDAEVVLGPATKVLRPRAWRGLELGRFVVPPKPHWLTTYEAAQQEGKDGDASEPAKAEETDAVEEGSSPVINSFYTPSTRHVYRTRQEVYDAFVAWYHDHIGSADTKCEELWHAETEWAKNWSQMVLFLQKQA